MKQKIQSLEDAFSGYPDKEQTQARKIARHLLGFPIIDLEFGPDPNGNPTIYYIVLSNGIKIGIAKVDKDGKSTKADRDKKFSDGSMLKFNFFPWPE